MDSTLNSCIRLVKLLAITFLNLRGFMKWAQNFNHIPGPASQQARGQAAWSTRNERRFEFVDPSLVGGYVVKG